MIGAALLIYSARGINRNYVKSAAGITLKLGDFYTCSYCLRVIKWDHHRTRPTKDHFFPKSKKQLLMGAKTSFVVCCQPCNSRKSDKVFSSIEEVREFIKSRKTATEA
jgi:5-methylcytosine-specific restriction endonuclease McrA